jgi:ABC-type multidrug transport system ATPase subunit
MPIIEVANLYKRYGDHVAVHDVSFTVDEGEILGILGPNGAGNTTTVESVTGLRRPDGGRISVLGLDPLRLYIHHELLHWLRQTRVYPHRQRHHWAAPGTCGTTLATRPTYATRPAP